MGDRCIVFLGGYGYCITCDRLLDGTYQCHITAHRRLECTCEYVVDTDFACVDAECKACGVTNGCGRPEHFHHDGCPVCEEDDDAAA